MGMAAERLNTVPISAGPKLIDALEVVEPEIVPPLPVHGNHQNVWKRVSIHCCIHFGELSIIVKDEGTGFDPTNLADPTDIANINPTRGRGIYLMRALMGEVRFEQGAGKFTCEIVAIQIGTNIAIRVIYRTICQSATIGRELAVRPVLLLLRLS